MRSTLVLFVAGAALGGAVIYLRGGDEPSAALPRESTVRESLRVPDAAPATSIVEFLTLLTGSIGPAERAALQRLVATADRNTLETLAEQASGLPPIEGRRVAFEILLARYAELDGPAAAAFARKLGLPPAAQRPLFATWARNDARGALQALAELGAAAALTLGVAVLETIGNDAAGIERVLAAAPQIDADRFRVEAALAKAPDDPEAALADLLALPPASLSTAFERLVVVWIDRDVYGALAGAEQIANQSSREEFLGALTRTWARLDPDALVDYLVDAAPERRDDLLRLGALEAFGLVAPARALRAAATVPGEVGALLTRAALMSVARDDPLEALRIAETLPSAADRSQMLGVIATSYGRKDPEAALAWAQSLRPPAPNVVANVLVGFAEVDPDRALDIMFRTMDAPGERGSTLLRLVANGALSAEHTAALAARLLATPGRSPELAMLARQWAQRQPHDAVRWLLANEGAAPSGTLAAAATQLARRDPAAAIDYLDGVGPELRATWLRATAEGYAQNDARAAARWITLHRGEMGYAGAVAAIAGASAANDPAAAARLFDSVDAAGAPDAARAAARIASAWAREDHRAAAAWAASIADENTRSTALGDIVRTLALRDPAAARELADRYLTDPAARRAAEPFLEPAR